MAIDEFVLKDLDFMRRRDARPFLEEMKKRRNLLIRAGLFTGLLFYGTQLAQNIIAPSIPHSNSVSAAGASAKKKNQVASLESILPGAKNSNYLREEDKIIRLQNTAKYWRAIEEAENRYHLPRGLLGGLVMWESNGIPSKRSSTGAVGLTMLTSIACRELKVNPGRRTESYFSIINGAKYLAWLIGREGGGLSARNIHDAVAKYELGPYTGVHGATSYSRRVLECANFYRENLQEVMNSKAHGQESKKYPDYKLVRRKSNGHDVYRLKLKEDRTANEIASGFNRYIAQRFSGKYNETDRDKVTDAKRNRYRGNIERGTIVFINVPRR